MGAIKDIVDLAADLETRAKDRKDIDVLHKIHSLAFSLQSHHAEIIERDVRLMEENAKLKKDLAEAQAEEIQIHRLIEFHRGKRTGGKWMAFCPKCKMPAGGDTMPIGKQEMAYCSALCGWRVELPTSLDSVIAEITI